MASALLEFETLDGEPLKEMLSRVPRGSFHWTPTEGEIQSASTNEEENPNTPDLSNPLPI